MALSISSILGLLRSIVDIVNSFIRARDRGRQTRLDDELQRRIDEAADDPATTTLDRYRVGTRAIDSAPQLVRTTGVPGDADQASQADDIER